jgi:putative transposase
MPSPFKYFTSSPEMIRLAVMMYVRYPLSLRNVEDLLSERGIDICHETVRLWWNRFGPMFAAEIKKRRLRMRQGCPESRWHLHEVFVKINGETHYLWRAVDHEGEVLEAVATKRRNRKAALGFLKRLMRKYGRPQAVVTDKLRSYGAAMQVIGNADRQECEGRWINNRAENSHQPLRRRERAMLRFRRMETLQKFASVHGTIHNHFNQERHLTSREIYQRNRSAALAEWKLLMATHPLHCRTGRIPPTQPRPTRTRQEGQTHPQKIGQMGNAAYFMIDQRDRTSLEKCAKAAARRRRLIGDV